MKEDLINDEKTEALYTLLKLSKILQKLSTEFTADDSELDDDLRQAYRTCESIINSVKDLITGFIETRLIDISDEDIKDVEQYEGLKYDF